MDTFPNCIQIFTNKYVAYKYPIVKIKIKLDQRYRKNAYQKWETCCRIRFRPRITIIIKFYCLLIWLFAAAVVPNLARGGLFILHLFCTHNTSWFMFIIIKGDFDLIRIRITNEITNVGRRKSKCICELYNFNHCRF